MNKYYVGQLSRGVTHLNVENKPAKVELAFKNGDFSEEMPFKLDREYYVVEKAELDAYMTRKEHLEQMNCTPVFGENQRLKAKVNELEAKIANLTKINKSLGEENSKLAEKQEALDEAIRNLYCGMCSAGCEIKAENEKLKAEVADLNKRISHLKVILEHDENRMAALITENNKLRGTNNELNAVIVQLRDNAQRAGYL